MDFWEFLKLAVLLFCVPLQLWLSQNTSPGDIKNSRSFSGGGFGMIQEAQRQWERGTAFLESQMTIIKKIRRRMKRGKHEDFDELDIGKSFAHEVAKFDYFAGSARPRKDRSGVKYRVGQVFKHKTQGYTGLIVGWDKKAKAPAGWLTRMEVSDADQQQPMYHVLLGGGDQSKSVYTYVCEKNIILLDDGAKIKAFRSKELGEHMDGYHKSLKMWIPNTQLRKLYPKD
eukprot:m.342328 g.342328  ORF g.342328 m.342328 type:complete len:228 (+) comp21242_c0_seq1:165-848(+)